MPRRSDPSTILAPSVTESPISDAVALVQIVRWRGLSQVAMQCDALILGNEPEPIVLTAFDGSATGVGGLKIGDRLNVRGVRVGDRLFAVVKQPV